MLYGKTIMLIDDFDIIYGVKMIITDMCEIQAPEPASKSPVPFSAS
jgi:hypothetical protein